MLPGPRFVYRFTLGRSGSPPAQSWPDAPFAARGEKHGLHSSISTKWLIREIFFHATLVSTMNRFDQPIYLRSFAVQKLASGRRCVIPERSLPHANMYSLPTAARHLALPAMALPLARAAKPRAAQTSSAASHNDQPTKGAPSPRSGGVGTADIFPPVLDANHPPIAGDGTLTNAPSPCWTSLQRLVRQAGIISCVRHRTIPTWKPLPPALHCRTTATMGG